MTEDSGFFSEPLSEGQDAGTMELIHRSRGGWSEIWRTGRNGRYIVLKALKQEFRGLAMYESLLRKEAEITSSLSHPCIREAKGVTNVPGLGSAIEMEWIDGRPLGEYIEAGGIPKSTALRLSGQLCDAVSYLHSRQTVHRDIKPENILVTHNGDNLKLIDFGLSDADSWATLKGSCGTPSFAAPEVLEGGKPGNRSDIWSMGKVLRLLLPGKRAVTAKCMASDPSKRYADASQVKAALHRKSPAPAVAAIAVLLLGAALAVFRPKAPAEVQDEQAIESPEVIDELFRQATQMIEDQEG